MRDARATCGLVNASWRLRRRSARAAAPAPRRRTRATSPPARMPDAARCRRVHSPPWRARRPRRRVPRACSALLRRRRRRDALPCPGRRLPARPRHASLPCGRRHGLHARRGRGRCRSTPTARRRRRARARARRRDAVVVRRLVVGDALAASSPPRTRGSRVVRAPSVPIASRRSPYAALDVGDGVASPAPRATRRPRHAARRRRAMRVEPPRLVGERRVECAVQPRLAPSPRRSSGAGVQSWGAWRSRLHAFRGAAPPPTQWPCVPPPRRAPATAACAATLAAERARSPRRADACADASVRALVRARFGGTRGGRRALGARVGDAEAVLYRWTRPSVAPLMLRAACGAERRGGRPRGGVQPSGGGSVARSAAGGEGASQGAELGRRPSSRSTVRLGRDAGAAKGLRDDGARGGRGPRPSSRRRTCAGGASGSAVARGSGADGGGRRPAQDGSGARALLAGRATRPARWRPKFRLARLRFSLVADINFGPDDDGLAASST